MSISVPGAVKYWVFHIAKVSGWARPVDGAPQLAVGVSSQAMQDDIKSHTKVWGTGAPTARYRRNLVY
jgi:hypothetical protein